MPEGLVLSVLGKSPSTSLSRWHLSSPALPVGVLRQRTAAYLYYLEKKSRKAVVKRNCSIFWEPTPEFILPGGFCLHLALCVDG